MMGLSTYQLHTELVTVFVKAVVCSKLKKKKQETLGSKVKAPYNYIVSYILILLNWGFVFFLLGNLMLLDHGSSYN